MSEKNNIALQTLDLSVGYSKLNPVLTDLNLNFQKRQFIGLVAKNGSGKSTLIKTLCGVIESLSGSVKINNRFINEYSKKELAKNVALVLTEKPNLAGFTVKDLISMGRYPYAGSLGKLNKNDFEAIEEAIELCEIAHLKDKFCNQLSDGEFQKSMLARAIAQQTSLLLLDEPTAFLDFPSKLNLMKLLTTISFEKNTCIIISSHDLELLQEYTQQLLVIKDDGTYSVIQSNSISTKALVEIMET